MKNAKEFDHQLEKCSKKIDNLTFVEMMLSIFGLILGCTTFFLFYDGLFIPGWIVMGMAITDVIVVYLIDRCIDKTFKKWKSLIDECKKKHSLCFFCSANDYCLSKSDEVGNCMSFKGIW